MQLSGGEKKISLTATVTFDLISCPFSIGAEMIHVFPEGTIPVFSIHPEVEVINEDDTKDENPTDIELEYGWTLQRQSIIKSSSMFLSVSGQWEKGVSPEYGTADTVILDTHTQPIYVYVVTGYVRASGAGRENITASDTKKYILPSLKVKQISFNKMRDTGKINQIHHTPKRTNWNAYPETDALNICESWLRQTVYANEYVTSGKGKKISKSIFRNLPILYSASEILNPEIQVYSEFEPKLLAGKINILASPKKDGQQIGGDRITPFIKDNTLAVPYNSSGNNGYQQGATLVSLATERPCYIGKMYQQIDWELLDDNKNVFLTLPGITHTFYMLRATPKDMWEKHSYSVPVETLETVFGTDGWIQQEYKEKTFSIEDAFSMLRKKMTERYLPFLYTQNTQNKNKSKIINSNFSGNLMDGDGDVGNYPIFYLQSFLNNINVSSPKEFLLYDGAFAVQILLSLIGFSSENQRNPIIKLKITDNFSTLNGGGLLEKKYYNVFYSQDLNIGSNRLEWSDYLQYKIGKTTKKDIIKGKK